MNFCERVRQEVEAQGRTLTSVLARAELGSSIFYKWEKGGKTPTARSVRAIASALGVKASSLDPDVSDAPPGAPSKNDEQLSAQSLTSTDDYVLVGMTKTTFNNLRPLLNLAKERVVKVPDEAARAVLSLIGGDREIYQEDFDIVMTTYLEGSLSKEEQVR